MDEKRERLGSRIGFLLMTAGCAIGLGNVWRFPYVVGKNGGAIFVLIYLAFLVLVGFPVMVAELSVGRAGQSDLPGSFKKLAPKHPAWQYIAHAVFTGNVILLMFYTVVTGWLLAYAWKYLTGTFSSVADCGKFFGDFVADWKSVLVFTAISIFTSSCVCAAGVKKGVERTVKVMLGGLFLLQLTMIVIVLTFDGSMEGVKFFLYPSLDNLKSVGIWTVIFEALMQAFFTLSLGIGSIAICGSYIGRDRSLAGESILVITLDTVAAMAAGLIIFPACFAFNAEPGQGPSLIFVTLAKVFNNMPHGRIFGSLFFVFMSVAALSTLITVAENIIAYVMRETALSRAKVSAIFCLLMTLLSLPCIFGFNLLSDFHPLGGSSNILDLEDFIVSDNLLPLGAAMIILFCTTDRGWGMKHFIAEASVGKGMSFPVFMAVYAKRVLPVVIFGIWGMNLYFKFFR